MKVRKRYPRFFSEELRRQIVKDLEQGKATIAQVVSEYSVSATSVYKWLDKYSKDFKRERKVVLQMKSEGYRSKELEKKVKELEASVGRKQLEIDFLNKLIEIAGDELGIDIKKKLSTKHSNGSESSIKRQRAKK